MSNEFLSQDEVDALLENVVDEPQPADAGGIRPYRLGQQDRAERARMPVLGTINDRFARLARAGLHDFLRRSAEITPAPVGIVKHGEFVAGLPAPAHLNLATVAPLRGHALFVLEPTLVSFAVDTLFGGDGRFGRGEQRDFTAAELRILHRLLAIVMRDYAKAWQDVHPLAFALVRTETHAPLACVAGAADPVVVSTFNVAFGGKGGAFHVCIPYATLAPLRDALERPADGERGAPDQRWHQRLQRRLQEADVELVANLAHAELRVADLLRLKVGDVLPIDLAPVVEARVHDVPMLACGYGEMNGRYALRVERFLHRDQGDHHA